MQPYDIESIVLGLVLQYGEEAARLCLPDLLPDKFVFRVDGNFGSDHSFIWKAIRDTYLNDELPPTYLNVAARLHGQYANELSMLRDRVESQYRIVSFDPKQFEMLCDLVDKAGIVYNAAAQGRRLAESLADVQAFMQTVATIQDVDEWLTERLTNLRQIMSRRSTGYTNVSEVAHNVVAEWEDLFSGKKQILLHTGFPSLWKHKLFPRGKMAVVHGLSGSGKSSFVFQLALGVAIDLYQRGEKGCVAINSLEMEQGDVIEKMAGIMAQVDVTKLINQTMTRPELDRLIKWMGYVEKLPIFIDNTKFITTTEMEYRASGLHVSEHGPVHMLVTDYGELFNDKDGGNEEQRINHIFRTQFRLARLINAAVIAISQSTVDKSASGRSYIAGPDGTRGSRGVLQASDIVCELYNPAAIKASGRQDLVLPEGYSPDHAYLLLQKARKGETNEAIELGWRPTSTTFFDYDFCQGAIPGRETMFDHFVDPFAQAVAAVTTQTQGSW